MAPGSSDVLRRAIAVFLPLAVMAGAVPYLLFHVQATAIESVKALTLRAFRKNHLKNELILARDGAEALDFQFATGAHAGSDVSDLPQVVLLDLKLPKLDGLEVVRRIRADERTRLLPFVILTSSKEDRDMIEGYRLGANSYVRKPVSFDELIGAVQQLGLYWLLLNERPPRPTICPSGTLPWD